MSTVSQQMTVFLHSYTFVFRHVFYFKLASDKGFRSQKAEARAEENVLLTFDFLLPS